jgi:hypothetical protein
METQGWRSGQRGNGGKLYTLDHSKEFIFYSKCLRKTLKGQGEESHELT